MGNTKVDPTLLAKAKFDLVKDKDKLRKYGLWPVSEVTPEKLAEAAKIRALEYKKDDAGGYLKELEIAVDRFKNHTERDIVESNYKRYLGFELAVEAAEADDPFSAILDD